MADENRPKAEERAQTLHDRESSGDYERIEDELEAKALTQLEAATESGAAETFLRFLDQRFHDAELDSQLYTEFVGASRALLGREASAFLTRLAYADPDDRPPLLENTPVNAETRRFLTEFATFHGTEVFRAWTTWFRTRLGDDWSGIRRDVYRDVETDEYRLVLQIRKNNGEMVRLESPPSSILHLAGSLAHAALIVTDRSQYDDFDVSRFAEAVERFESVFSDRSTGEATAASEQPPKAAQ